VIDVTGSRSRIVHRPRPQDDPEHRRPDVSRAQELLGLTPHTMLKEGLASTIAYFDELLADQKLRTQLVQG
jgi:UDP-glucuronate decarboxylase